MGQDLMSRWRSETTCMAFQAERMRQFAAISYMPSLNQLEFPAAIQPLDESPIIIAIHDRTRDHRPHSWVSAWRASVREGKIDVNHEDWLFSWPLPGLLAEAQKKSPRLVDAIMETAAARMYTATVLCRIDSLYQACDEHRITGHEFQIKLRALRARARHLTDSPIVPELLTGMVGFDQNADLQDVLTTPEFKAYALECAPALFGEELADAIMQPGLSGEVRWQTLVEQMGEEGIYDLLQFVLDNYCAERDGATYIPQQALPAELAATATSDFYDLRPVIDPATGRSKVFVWESGIRNIDYGFKYGDAQLDLRIPLARYFTAAEIAAAAAPEEEAELVESVF